MNITAEEIWSAVREIREKAPVMAHAEEEVEAMAGIASALVINIGTLSPAWVRSMFRVAEAARKRHARQGHLECKT